MRVVVVAVCFFAITGCGMLNHVKTASASSAAKKDCAACAKMCSVAADAEKNPDALKKCQDDCAKTCQ